MFFTQLLKTALLDREKDTVTLEADERIWELYEIDYYNYLKGKEVAQTLYTYIASLPDNPALISFSRIRERLLLTSPVPEQNRLIKNALLAMEKIGYIEYSIIKKGRESFLSITKINNKIKLLYESDVL